MKKAFMALDGSGLLFPVSAAGEWNVWVGEEVVLDGTVVGTF